MDSIHETTPLLSKHVSEDKTTGSGARGIKRKLRILQAPKEKCKDKKEQKDGNVNQPEPQANEPGSRNHVRFEDHTPEYYKRQSTDPMVVPHVPFQIRRGHVDFPTLLCSRYQQRIVHDLDGQDGRDHDVQDSRDRDRDVQEQTGRDETGDLRDGGESRKSPNLMRILAWSWEHIKGFFRKMVDK